MRSILATLVVRGSIGAALAAGSLRGGVRHSADPRQNDQFEERRGCRNNE
jgi:hypothetical protein